MFETNTITPKKIFDTIKLSLNGVEQDYTDGSLRAAVILLAIPMILELSLESVFAVVDMFFVGKLGQNAIATVGLTESVMTLVYSVAIGLSTAATAIVSRRIGEKDPDAATHAGMQSIYIGLVFGVLIMLLGMFFATDILKTMGASSDVVRDGAIFTRIMFGGSIAISMLFLINGIFRGAGNAAIAMKSLWIASGVNIILCPILIYFLGLKGAACATVIGRFSGMIYQIIYLLRGTGALKFRNVNFNFDFPIIKSIIKLAWPATFQFLIQSGSWIVIIRLVAETSGTTASAGFQIAIRNVIFFLLPAWGLSNVAATLVGQNLGAKKIDRAEQSVNLLTKYNIVYMSVAMVFFVFFPEYIIRIFTADESVIYYGKTALRTMGYSYIFYGIGMVMTAALNGAGDTRTPTIINFVGFWLFQIPLGYFLAYTLNLKAEGAIMAIPISETIIACVAWYFFRRGRWKTMEV